MMYDDVDDDDGADDDALARHDLSGRSTARGSFVIWTHNLKNITLHDTFRPAGAPTSETHDNG